MEAFEFSQLELPVPHNKLDDLGKRQLLHNIMALMLAQRFEIFDTENDGKWQPLTTAAYNARLALVPSKNRKKKSAVKILQSTGKLRQSFSNADGPGNSFRETIVSGDVAALRSHVEYAAIHNFGGVIKHPGTKNGFGIGITIPAHNITIPRRPFDQFREKDTQDIEEMILEFIGG